MIGILRTATICAALALPLGAVAQDQASDAETETPTADGNDPSLTGLSMGSTEGEAGEPQVGQTYVAEVIEDWQVRCVKTEEGKDPCQLYQLLKDGDGNSVAEFSIFNLPEGQEAVAGATIITPLETLLTADLRLAVDAGQARRYPYSFCSQIGCFARVGFTQGEIDALKRGNAANVTIVPAAAPNETVGLSVSLSGFTAGWNALLAANAQ
ncbi:MAG: invasion associated locus B family protein [Silicimonas sp.]|nr:invasion associated locus B family protein [Silicimonas sp.]MBT8424726.1 invasion associated locus B family protein [Silicimonas sp.]NND17584.1 invasion associated locus B family protein [Silicimonas sp.]NNL36312.1 invasion associated locus B family protein [Silicimonas sp.]